MGKDNDSGAGGGLDSQSGGKAEKQYSFGRVPVGSSLVLGMGVSEALTVLILKGSGESRRGILASDVDERKIIWEAKRALIPNDIIPIGGSRICMVINNREEDIVYLSRVDKPDTESSR